MTLQFKNLLILEDEAIIAMDAEACLEAAGHHVATVASSVRQALRALQDAGDRIDFAILDFNLPDGNSLPVADMLDRRGVPFAFVTSEHPRHLADRGIEPRRVFQKPTDYAVIAESVVAQREAELG